MPRIKQDLVLTLARNLRAYLTIDMGVGRQVPALRGSPEIQAPPARGPKRPGGKPSSKIPQAKKANGRQIKPASIQQRNSTVAIPEPDDSVGRRQFFRSMVSPLKKGKMLDLGAGPGHYSLDGAKLGWEVTAVDARTMRTPDPEEEKTPERAELIRKINWVQADVREFPINGEYDLICVFGLLHHLRIEDHLNLLSRCSDTLTLLNARVSPEIQATEGPYEGRIHQEPGVTRKERDDIAAVSWGNETSFIHTEDSLLRLVRDCGFIGAMPVRPPHTRDYSFYVCLPPAG